ncbi:HAD family hydrolase [Ktedonosporobacter rubrisoli]|uniref:HAD family hydrolase n=1 Tax=Ktedonosporobacter rubrisoli TaxID=2509675 RepID=A0A4P6JU88_KTERU|nr:HAD-IA family hydrolase [Ktedonosporobacter rubrisoli]QBD79024.1 HAD family hydrolase [Ktedonosporobacter rubrisoli]
MPFEQPQSIRTIFFDAGFTLLRPFPSTPELCQRVCKELDLHIHLDELMDRMTEAEKFFVSYTRLHREIWASEQAIAEFYTEYYVHLLRPFVEEQDEKRLHQLALAISEEFDKHTSWELYPDVIPTLEALRAHGGYTMGIISDWGIALNSILHRLKLTKYFDCLLVSASIRHAKPSPMLYELALQRANAIADYTLHIGDSYIQDVLGARAVGITPVLLDRTEKLAAHNLDCALVHSLYELLDLLEVERP